MNITVNGEICSVLEGTAVLELIAVSGDKEKPRGIAIACNGEVVRRGDWGIVILHEGDAIEIVKAAQGG